MRPADGAARAGDEELQRRILHASPNAVVGIDEGGRITYVNPQAEATFGYRSADLLGRQIEMLLPERLAAQHVNHRNGFLAHPVARPMGIGLELAGRRRDGTEFPVEISLLPVDGPKGREVFATVVDITLRKNAEAALAESERRFRAVLEASPNAIIAVDPDGRITYANPRTQTTFDYAPDELIGEHLTTLIPDRFREVHIRHREEYVKHPVARPTGIGMDLVGRRKDGREFPVEISLSPVETGEGLQVFATVVDITSRKATEQQLLQSQKLESIGRLAGGVAHDFNNILFAINGYAELLEEDVASLPPGQLADIPHSIQAIHTAADRGSKLTQQLLAFSRQQIVSPEVVNPVHVIRALEPMLRRLIGENIGLEVHASGEIGRVRIDPGQLDQIVMNLVVNARDAMPDGGRVTIQLANAVFDEAYALEHFEVSPGAFVQIAVTDTGVGIDRETQEHIFEPFFTTKEQGRGTGLGLATIYGIVRQAGGHIWLYSELGRGTTFKIYFPRVADGEEPAAPPRAQAAVGGSERLLLVEDEPAVRDMTRRVLERAGYDVTAMADGQAAVEALKDPSASFDVLVSDVVMPKMSGIDLAERALSMHAGMGIVLLSGYTAETLDLERLLKRGARFVPKPVATGELLRAIREASAVRGRPS